MEETTETKFATAAKVTIALFDGWKNFGYDQSYYKKMVTTISDVIYQCPKIPSGYISEKAYGLTSKELCKEHFYSRTQSARKMVDLMQKGILSSSRIDRFEKFMKSRARVHYVTSQENTKLIKYQNNPELNHWKKQYDAAGIELREYDKSKPKIYYSIDDINFDTASHVAKHYNCHTSTVHSRCSSEKWPEWKRVSK